MPYFNLPNYLDKKRRLINRALNKYLSPHQYAHTKGIGVEEYIGSGDLLADKKNASSVQQAMRYASFPGGKRLRPVLTIAACETCGGKIEDALPVACAIELIHNYSLIHDDLPAIDNDDYRRGKLTCHRKFGEAIALLAGDALLTRAFEILAASSPQVTEEIARSIGTAGLIGGEAEEIGSGQRAAGSGQEEIKRIYLKKTGALIRTAVVCGGMIAHASRQQLQALRCYGNKFGLAFQISDDILDYGQDRGINWARLFGLAGAKKEVNLLISQAKISVKVFGRQAEILKALADLIKRRH